MPKLGSKKAAEATTIAAPPLPRLFKLGDTVKDRHSSFSGVLTSSYRLFNGSMRFSVSGEDKDGMPKSLQFDEPQLELIVSAGQDMTPVPSGEIKMGAHVVERTSGWRATVVAEYLYLNGCVRYEISGPDKDGQPVLIVIDEALLEPLASAPIENQLVRTGGSTDRTPVSR